MDRRATRSMCRLVFANESKLVSDTTRNLGGGGLSHDDGAGGRLIVETENWVVHGLVSSMSSISESWGVRNASADTRGDCMSCIVVLVGEENEQSERALVGTLRNVQLSACSAGTYCLYITLYII